MCHRNWPHFGEVPCKSCQITVSVLGCWNMVKTWARHIKTNRKNHRVLQLSGKMQFEFEFFIYILFMTYFYLMQLSTNGSYCSGVHKKSVWKWIYVVYTCKQPAYRKIWLQGCSSTRKASASVFIAASLCSTSCNLCWGLTGRCETQLAP
jgi:hypothetical protein